MSPTQPSLFQDLPISPTPSGPFGNLEPYSFDLIMADPPWSFATYSDTGITIKGASGQYRIMDIDDIKALPVWTLAAPDCILWMWSTAPHLRQALDVMDAWRFEYSTCGSWAKRTKNGKLRWGTGYRLRSTSEPFLIGTRGKPKNKRNVASHIDGLAREHSRKPEAAFAAAEKLMPSARRLELFSRQSRHGWSTWGDEAEKFDGIAGASPL